VSKFRRRHSTAAALSVALAVAGLFTGTAAAQDKFLSRPVRIVCPFPPGGGADSVARLLAERLAERLSQAVVVDNRAGASGAIGMSIVAGAAPDGHTLLLGSSSNLAASPALNGIPYKAVIKDFTPLSLVSSVSYILVIHPSLPAKTTAEFIRAAKAQPGRLNYGTSGTGSASHLAMELFKHMAGVNVVHIPYKGSAPSVIALIGGEVQAGFNNLVPALPHVKSGRLRALGLSGSSRWSLLPEVPTIAESGLPGYEAVQWYGMLLPAGARPSITDRLSREIAAVLQQPDLRERMTQEGVEVIGSDPARFARHIESEIAKWSRVVKAANLRPE
jgi:tripartite-type tricarboxylate transporter receptor subunit TctC